jgi:hypothetical protein
MARFFLEVQSMDGRSLLLDLNFVVCHIRFIPLRGCLVILTLRVLNQPLTFVQLLLEFQPEPFQLIGIQVLAAGEW